MLNLYRCFASLSDAKPSFFPSGENSGKAVNPPKLVTCSRPLPSGFTMNSSNLRPSQLCLFEEKIIFLPFGVKDGAKLAQPTFVILRAFFPLVSDTNRSIFMVDDSI